MEELNIKNEESLIVYSSAGPYVSLSADSEPDYLNLITTGYLNLQDDPEVLKVADECLHVNGVGSCGPRGFYGTVDVHLDLENQIAEFMQTEQAVLYSSGFSTISSVIPAFSKPQDYLFVDKGVCFETQTGVYLAKSKTFWFKHNDFLDLSNQFEKMNHIFDAVHRIFVVLEGIYFNHADIAPLPNFLQLQVKYPFRIIINESHSIGVLGKTGRGITEHFGFPISSVDIITASIGNALGANGGFSVGSKQVTSHQRLSSSAYVFSCALPPFVAKAATKSLEIIKEKNRIDLLSKNCALLHQLLKKITSMDVLHQLESPIAHLRLKNTVEFVNANAIIQNIVNQLRNCKILVARSYYCKQEKNTPPPSIRITICAKHTKDDLEKAINQIETISVEVLKKSLF